MLNGLVVTACFTFGGQPTSGVSDAATNIQQRAKEIRKRLDESAALGLNRAPLYEMYSECAQSGWDGYDARPVQHATVQQALSFLDALPVGLPTPSFGADPDGDVTVEWYKSPTKVVSVSVSPVGHLTYAALLGSRRLSGAEFFVGQTPKQILELISDVSV